MQVQGPKDFGHPLLLSQAINMELEQLGLEPVSIWDASTKGGSLDCYATVLIQDSFLLIGFNHWGRSTGRSKSGGEIEAGIFLFPRSWATAVFLWSYNSHRMAILQGPRLNWDAVLFPCCVPSAIGIGWLPIGS